MPVTKTFYYFSELSKEAKDNAIENCMWKGTDNDYWYRSIIRKWETKLPSFGFDNAKISFRLTYSQGDGASFTANIDILTFLRPILIMLGAIAVVLLLIIGLMSLLLIT